MNKREGRHIMAVLEKYAPPSYDPHTDDMTVQFALQLAEKDREIRGLKAELGKMYDAAVHLAGALANPELKVEALLKFGALIRRAPESERAAPSDDPLLTDLATRDQLAR